MLIPRQKTPPLEINTLNHGVFSLETDSLERGTIVCFYRGLHCPICAKYLTEFEKLADEFNSRGLATIAISSDTKERAEAMKEKIGSTKLQFGYGFELSAAREWGLYISTSRGKTSIGIEEPALFSEPGLFMVSKERALYYGSVQTMPFVRPNFSELLGALDFAIANNYPARGEYTGAV